MPGSERNETTCRITTLGGPAYRLACFEGDEIHA
jgi:hypothetical protein